MQSEILHAFRSSRRNAAKQPAGERAQNLPGTVADTRQDVVRATKGEPEGFSMPETGAEKACRDIAISFLRLANLDNDIVDRLSRYEATLWRQAGQILFALDALDRQKRHHRIPLFRPSRRQPSDEDSHQD